MGQSTNAILFYGYCWTEETSDPWEIGLDADADTDDADTNDADTDDADTDDADGDWEARYARTKGCLPPSTPLEDRRDVRVPRRHALLGRMPDALRSRRSVANDQQSWRHEGDHLAGSGSYLGRGDRRVLRGDGHQDRRPQGSLVAGERLELTMKPVNFVCPLCRQELTLETFEEDFVPPRRLRVLVARIPNHPLPLIAVCDARLAINCPTSNQVVYERCDGEHVFEDTRPRDRQCLDPACWTKEPRR